MSQNFYVTAPSSGTAIKAEAAADGSLLQMVEVAGRSPTDHSSTIAAAGVAQQLMAANPSRYGFSFFNSSVSDLWINWTGANASAGGSSVKVTSGSLYETPSGMSPQGTISVYGAAAGQSFACTEF